MEKELYDMSKDELLNRINALEAELTYEEIKKGNNGVILANLVLVLIAIILGGSLYPNLFTPFLIMGGLTASFCLNFVLRLIESNKICKNKIKEKDEATNQLENIITLDYEKKSHEIEQDISNVMSNEAYYENKQKLLNILKEYRNTLENYNITKNLKYLDNEINSQDFDMETIKYVLNKQKIKKP